MAATHLKTPVSALLLIALGLGTMSLSTNHFSWVIIWNDMILLSTPLSLHKTWQKLMTLHFSDINHRNDEQYCKPKHNWRLTQRGNHAYMNSVHDHPDLWSVKQTYQDSCCAAQGSRTVLTLSCSHVILLFFCQQ